MHRLENDVNRLVDRLMTDYEKGRDIDVIDGVTPPDQDEIVKMIYQLRNIIFPSYSQDKNYRIYTVRNNLSMQLEDLLFNLSRQISLVLKYSESFAGAADNELLLEGERLALEFLGKLTDIRELIETDLQAAYDGDPAASPLCHYGQPHSARAISYENTAYSENYDRVRAYPHGYRHSSGCNSR